MRENRHEDFFTESSFASPQLNLKARPSVVPTVRVLSLLSLLSPAKNQLRPRNVLPNLLPPPSPHFPPLRSLVSHTRGSSPLPTADPKECPSKYAWLVGWQNSGGDAKYRFPPPQVFQQREKLDSRTLGYADVGNFSLSPHVDPWVIAWPRIPFWCTDPGKNSIRSCGGGGGGREKRAERRADSGQRRGEPFASSAAR